MEINEMVVRGSELSLQIAALKEKIVPLQEELDGINADLIKAMPFKNGCKTAHMVESGIRVTGKKSETVKWLQDRLLLVQQNLPEVFNNVFVTEFKPVNIKLVEKARLEDENFNKAIAWASEIKTGKPAFSYERVEDDERGPEC